MESEEQCSTESGENSENSEEQCFTNDQADPCDDLPFQITDAFHVQTRYAATLQRRVRALQELKSNEEQEINHLFYQDVPPWFLPKTPQIDVMEPAVPMVEFLRAKQDILSQQNTTNVEEQNLIQNELKALRYELAQKLKVHCHGKSGTTSTTPQTAEFEHVQHGFSCQLCEPLTEVSEVRWTRESVQNLLNQDNGMDSQSARSFIETECELELGPNVPYPVAMQIYKADELALRQLRGKKIMQNHVHDLLVQKQKQQAVDQNDLLVQQQRELELKNERLHEENMKLRAELEINEVNRQNSCSQVSQVTLQENVGTLGLVPSHPETRNVHQDVHHGVPTTNIGTKLTLCQLMALQDSKPPTSLSFHSNKPNQAFDLVGFLKDEVHKGVDFHRKKIQQKERADGLNEYLEELKVKWDEDIMANFVDGIWRQDCMQDCNHHDVDFGGKMDENERLVHLEGKLKRLQHQLEKKRIQIERKQMNEVKDKENTLNQEMTDVDREGMEKLDIAKLVQQIIKEKVTLNVDDSHEFHRETNRYKSNENEAGDLELEVENTTVGEDVVDIALDNEDCKCDNSQIKISIVQEEEPQHFEGLRRELDRERELNDQRLNELEAKFVRFETATAELVRESPEPRRQKEDQMRKVKGMDYELKVERGQLKKHIRRVKKLKRMHQDVKRRASQLQNPPKK